MTKSIADVGTISEDLLLHLQPSTSKLFFKLTVQLFIRSLIIAAITVFFLNLLWFIYDSYINISWLFLVESGLAFSWAGMVGTFRLSISINKLIQMITKAERINKHIINKALRSSLAYSILGIFFFIYAAITGGFGLHMLII